MPHAQNLDMVFHIPELAGVSSETKASVVLAVQEPSGLCT